MSASPILPPAHHNDPPPERGERLLPAGTTFGDAGRYSIVDIIAIGGMSTIYQARDAHLGAICVLKVQHLEGVSEEDAEAFRTEAQLLADIQFPGVVAVRDVFEEGPYALIAMDFIDGDNLYDRHRRTGRRGEDAQSLPISPVPEDQVVLYGIALARTLQHLHSRVPAIVHRDMKPHNVMRRSTDGSVVLLDFGIARRLDGPSGAYANDDLGTPGYAAPEQYERGSSIDARADVYGLGVLLTELATGYNPRADDAARFVPAVCGLRKGLSPSLCAILQKCVEREPDSRFQSAGEIAEALDFWRKTPSKLRRNPIPTPIWTVDVAGRATGQMQSHDDVIYTADSAGAVYAIESSGGHIEFELNGASDLPVDVRFKLLRMNQFDRNSATVARISSSSAGSHVMLYSDMLLPLQRIDESEGRIFASWCGNQDLVIAASAPPCVSRLSPAPDGEWRYRWRIRLHSPPTSVTACGDDALILNSNGVMKRVDPNGERVWQQAIPLWSQAAPAAVTVLGGVIIAVAARAEAPMTAIDAASGEIMWQTQGAGDILAEPIVDPQNEILMAATRDVGITALRLCDGEILERHSDFTLPLVGMTCFLPGSSIVALTEYGSGARVMLYDYTNRRVLWSEAFGERGAVAAPILCGSIMAVQDLTGRIHAWKWEDSR